MVRFVIPAAAGLMWAVAATAQAPASSPAKTNDAQADAVELLRRVIAEQQKHPDKIIRTPTGRAETKPAVTAPAAPRFTRAELERQFIDGKLTAKQFQRAMEELEKNPPPPATVGPAGKTVPGREVVSGSGPATAVAPTVKAGTVPMRALTNQAGVVVTVPAVEDEPDQKALADVEAKIDEILARRDALQQAGKTNAAGTNAVPAGPMTKRQKMDALLRQLIQGKITEQEYNAQREKLLALPD